MLDFGAVKRLPDGMPPQIGALLTLALRRRRPGRGRRAARRGLHQDLDRGRPDPVCWPTSSRSSSRPGDDFRRSPGPGCATLFGHINDPRRPQWSIGLKLNLPPEYLLIHRVWLGGIGVLCQIEGEVEVLEVLAEWLPGFDVEALDYVRWVDEE